MRAISAAALVLLSLFPVDASAQDGRPPAEIGGGYGGFLVMNRGGDYTVGSTRPAVDVRLTVPFTPRFSFEALTTISSRTSATALHVTNGIYMFQVKQRLQSASGERFHAFLSYGGAGYYAHLHQDPVTTTLPSGMTSSSTEYSYNQTDAPFFAVFGGGVQRELTHRAAVRVEAQLLTLAWSPFAVRLSAGVSIPFESYRVQ